MFLAVLNLEEKKAFAGLAQKMIEVDGIVVGEEEKALAALQAELGASKEPEQRQLSELAAAFTNRRSKVVALLELIGLGFTDASYSVAESSFIAEVATLMEIDQEEIPHLESWVREHVSLVRRALVMMQG